MLITDDDAGSYAYNRWANERVLKSCAQLTPEEYARPLGSGWSSVRDTLVHIASATRAWHDRFHGHSTDRLLTGADLPTLGEAEKLLLEASADMEEFVLSTPAGRRGEILTYRNLKGETRKVYYWAVFHHVVNHATYHRGQIATMVRMLGHDPKPTDLVFWAILNTPQD